MACFADTLGAGGMATPGTAIDCIQRDYPWGDSNSRVIGTGSIG